MTKVSCILTKLCLTRCKLTYFNFQSHQLYKERLDCKEFHCFNFVYKISKFIDLFFNFALEVLIFSHLFIYVATLSWINFYFFHYVFTQFFDQICVETYLQVQSRISNFHLEFCFEIYSAILENSTYQLIILWERFHCWLK